MRDKLKTVADLLLVATLVIALTIGLAMIGMFGVLVAGGRVSISIDPVATQCRDGIVQQGRGDDLVPVHIKGTKRTIPCE